MLESIRIKSLFGLYSYTLDLNVNNSRVCFITGPNGYGKTTILNILNYIYTGQWNKLKHITFDELVLSFSDGYILRIVQLRSVGVEGESDEHPEVNVSIKVSLK